ncbi:ABC transporter ATP-binding protein [Sinomonas humi]|uniref:ABC transporter ATP-binding protein n=1 Tax=Sinomonas humi TaxID=1338436 RepID=UPI0009DCB85A|nr:ABC transporter ATP-binding protein [Sinomonas humi]
MSELLRVTEVSRHFGGVKAVDNVSLSIDEGERVALIGPNGAGKSTLVNCLSGVTKVSAGEITFLGESINAVSAPSRARMGISRTFQNLEMFGSMTVLENVLTAVDAGTRFGSSLWPPTARARRAVAMESLATLGVEEYAHAPTSALPYGVRKLVELARAFVTRPKLLLLDEPVAGLADTEQFLDTLHAGLDQLGCGVLLIEHDMVTVQRLASHVYVLDSGRLIAEGTYNEIVNDKQVIEAYLGTGSTFGTGSTQISGLAN